MSQQFLDHIFEPISQCSAMLTSGEIDLFGNVSYIPERAELFDFSSYLQGKDTWMLA